VCFFRLRLSPPPGLSVFKSVCVSARPFSSRVCAFNLGLLSTIHIADVAARLPVHFVFLQPGLTAVRLAAFPHLSDKEAKGCSRL